MEFLLSPKNARTTIFPIVHEDIWFMYKKQQAAEWTAEEVPLAEDLDDWNNKLNDNERFFIKQVLAFFAGADAIVADNLAMNFENEVTVREAKFFYSLQGTMENVHSEMYSLLIETYIRDTDEKARLFNSIANTPVIGKKAAWAEQYMNPANASFAERMIGFAIVEGVFFSSSFASIFYIKKRGFMNGLTLSNEYISKDEGLHCDFACLLYTKYIVNRLPEARVHQIFKDAVDIEIEFVEYALPVELIGMNARLMGEYVKFVANFWLVRLGYTPLYPGVTNPFEFMELISISGVSNFFERKVSDYNRANIGTKASDRVFTLDEQF